MKLLKWQPEYSVGVESVDDEHREMIEMINDLYSKLGEAPAVPDIEKCLEDIFSRISLHFALEERIMRDNGYAEYAEHKEDHEDLLDDIRDMMDGVITDADAGLDELETRLSKWFASHFATFDARLHGKLGAH